MCPIFLAGLLGAGGRTLFKPKRYAGRAKPSTTRAPVVEADCFRVWGLQDQAAAALAFSLTACLPLHAQDKMDASECVRLAMPGRVTSVLATSGPLLEAGKLAVAQAFR